MREFVIYEGIHGDMHRLHAVNVSNRDGDAAAGRRSLSSRMRLARRCISAMRSASMKHLTSTDVWTRAQRQFGGKYVYFLSTASRPALARQRDAKPAGASPSPDELTGTGLLVTPGCFWQPSGNDEDRDPLCACPCAGCRSAGMDSVSLRDPCFLDGCLHRASGGGLCRALKYGPAATFGRRARRRQSPARNDAALWSLGLTARECEILGLLAAGQSNKEMARQLDISPNTVKDAHIASLAIRSWRCSVEPRRSTKRVDWHWIR